MATIGRGDTGEQEPETTWECTECIFINKSYARACAACFAAQKKEQLQSRPDAMDLCNPSQTLVSNNHIAGDKRKAPTQAEFNQFPQQQDFEKELSLDQQSKKPCAHGEDMLEQDTISSTNGSCSIQNAALAVEASSTTPKLVTLVVHATHKHACDPWEAGAWVVTEESSRHKHHAYPYLTAALALKTATGYISPWVMFDKLGVEQADQVTSCCYESQVDVDFSR